MKIFLSCYWIFFIGKMATPSHSCCFRRVLPSWCFIETQCWHQCCGQVIKMIWWHDKFWSFVHSRVNYVFCALYVISTITCQCTGRLSSHSLFTFISDFKFQHFFRMVWLHFTRQLLDKSRPLPTILRESANPFVRDEVSLCFCHRIAGHFPSKQHLPLLWLFSIF